MIIANNIDEVGDIIGDIVCDSGLNCELTRFET